MKSVFCKVEILSPVHIGSGDTVDPFHYLIDDHRTCHFIDPGAWAADHPDPEELARQFSSGNIAEMRASMAAQIDPTAYAERSCRVVSDKIISDYESHLNTAESRNQLLLSPNLIAGGGGPLLPGSSLKGAIRTAVIDWLDQEKNLRLKESRNLREQSQNLERFFGSISENSFQALKIADCEAACDSSLIVEARELRRNPEKAVTPKASCEILASRLLGEEGDHILNTRIVLGRPDESGAELKLKNGEKLDWTRLCELVNAYSSQRYQEEQQKFWNREHFIQTREALQQIENQILTPPPDSMVLKVGHYSQVEYVTVKNNRPQTRKAKDGGNLPHGTTRTLADGIYPFGWVLLTPCREAEYLLLQQQRDQRNYDLRQKRENQREHYRQVVAVQREEALRQRKKREQQQREREERLREEQEKPWLTVVRQLVQVSDWGSLKQTLQRDDLKAFCEEKSLAEAILNCAEKLRQQRPDKWNNERSEQVNNWLEPSGLELQPFEQKDSDSFDQPEDYAQIEALTAFGDYQAAGINPEQLSPQALQCLVDKMKQWGCDHRKAKKNKQQAYKHVLSYLKK